MLPQNYQQKRVMDSMMRNYTVGKHFGLDKTKGALMEVMVKHNITTDPSKLKGYQREAFLKDIKSKTGITYEGKKAFESMYGQQKPEQTKAKEEIKNQPTNKQGSYSEIMAQKKLQEEKIAAVNSGARKSSVWSLMGFRSDKNVNASRDLIAKADNYNKQATADNYDDAKSMIDRIQS